MKTMNTLLLAGAAALGFTLTTTAKAAEPFLSPKARASQIGRVSSVATSPNIVSGNYLGTLTKTEANRTKVVPGTGNEPNLVSGNHLGAGAKSPYPRTVSFQGTPLIAKDMPGMFCEAGCTMACCAKK